MASNWAAKLSVINEQEHQNQPRPSGKLARRELETINYDDINENRSEDPDIKANFENRLYKMYEVPASYNKAHVHAEAFKFGINNFTTQVGSRGSKCECCDHYIASEELSLCHPVEVKKQSESSGSRVGRRQVQLPLGVSLYFSFIKMIIKYLVIRFLVFDCYNMYISMFGSYCSNLLRTRSTDLCTITLSGYNLKDSTNQDTHWLDLLNFLFTIISIIYFIHFKQFMEAQRNEARLENVNEDDFSILLENIPVIIYNKYDEIRDANCDHELELQRLLERKIRLWLQTFNENPAAMRHLEQELNTLKKQLHQDKKDINVFIKEIVKGITICYDLTEIENINTIRDGLIEDVERINEQVDEEYGKLLREEEDGPFGKQMRESTMVQYLPNQIKMINEKYIRVCESFQQLTESGKESTTEFKLSHFTGRAIITFQYQHFRDYLIREYEEDPQFFQINGSNISIRRASRPTDIYWFNMKIKDDQRTTNARYSWGVLTMLLIISFAAFVGLELLQASEAQRETSGHASILHTVRKYAITASTSLLATAINFVLGYTIQLLAKMERHKTKSDQLSSLVFKTIVTQTINTCFIYLILYFIQPINPMGAYGLVNKVIGVVIVSGFVTVALQTLRPGEIIKNYINRGKEKDNEGKKSFKTVQTKLNKSYEHPMFGIAENYSFYIVITFTVSFYGFLVPLATPITILIFFLEYWVDKYNLFRRSAPINYGFLLGKQIFTVFEVSLFLFTFGYFLFDLIIHSDGGVKIKLINILSLLISGQYAGFYLVVPLAIKNRIVESQDTLDPKSYDEYKEANMFPSTFHNENPATAFLKEKSYPKPAKQLQSKEKGTMAPSPGLSSHPPHPRQN